MPVKEYVPGRSSFVCALGNPAIHPSCLRSPPALPSQSFHPRVLFFSCPTLPGTKRSAPPLPLHSPSALPVPLFPLSPARIVLPPKPFTLQYAPLLPQPKPLPLNMPQKLQPLTNDASPLSWLCWNTVASRVGSPCLIPAAVTLLPARLSNKCQNHEPALVGTAEALAQFALPTSVPRWDAGRKKKGTSEEKTGSVVAPFLFGGLEQPFRVVKAVSICHFPPSHHNGCRYKLFTF